MVQVIQASELTLHKVKEKFNLQEVEDEVFFQEWQDDLPEVTDAINKVHQAGQLV